MGEWRVVWEVVVRGTRDQAIDVMRQNAAMGWMMLTMAKTGVISKKFWRECWRLCAEQSMEIPRLHPQKNGQWPETFLANRK